MASADAPVKSEPWLVYLVVIFAFNTLTEVNLLTVRLLGKWKVLKNKVVLQVLSLVIVSYASVAFWLQVAVRVFGDTTILSHSVAQIVIIIGVFLLLISHILVLMSNIAHQWVDARKEVDKLKRAKILSDYNSLQDRLNPHFLFNNLSVLRSLIRYSPDDAERFIENFTDVYRYVLRSHESQTVSVKTELEFLGAYIALHKERLGEGLTVEINISEGAMEGEIPPMSIQLLVENAIKHNVASRRHPLRIQIYSEDQFLWIKNSVNKKETTYSTKTGLKTLLAQYKLISAQQIVITEDDAFYTVKLPML